MNCPKCASTFLQVCVGYSQEDSRGDAYRYVFCIMCGFVRHQLSVEEQTAQIHARIANLDETLCVNQSQRSAKHA